MERDDLVVSPKHQWLNVSCLCCVCKCLVLGCAAVCASGPEDCSGKYSKFTPTVCIVLQGILQVCVSGLGKGEIRTARKFIAQRAARSSTDQRRLGLLCSSRGVFSNRFSCFVLVSRLSTCVCVCVCVCVYVCVCERVAKGDGTWVCSDLGVADSTPRLCQTPLMTVR